ncbi:hypothetical protein FEH17_23565 [Escherichia coli]|nr:hypothetical protein [Escherichia coli]
MSIKNDGHYFCRARGNRPDGLNEPVTDKSAGSGFERCEATARRVAGRTPAINCQTSNQAKGHPKGWPFCFSN